METNSTTDFERLEQLLRTKRFDELSDAEKASIRNDISEEEYISMYKFYANLDDSTRQAELAPTLNIKHKLDIALRSNHIRPVFLQRRIPIYQSVAVAILVFCIGLFANFFSPEQLIVQRTVHVVKYVPKVVIKEVRVPVLPTAQQVSTKVNSIEDIEATPYPSMVESIDNENPFFAKQQEIALNNIQRALDENCGTSMGSDTLLQKMMVTIY